MLKCGTRDALPGFAVLDRRRRPRRVRRRLLPGHRRRHPRRRRRRSSSSTSRPSARFTALQSGEIDVLVRNTTWTAGRDGGEGATFLQPTFYDGQGMMVERRQRLRAVADMDGTSICVAAGTTTEGNVAAEFARLGLDLVEVLSFDDTALLQEAFMPGPLRRLVVRHLPAHRLPLRVPRRPRRAAHPRRRVLEGAARPGRPRRRHRLGPGRRTGRSSPPSRPRSSASLEEHRRLRRQRRPQHPHVPRRRTRRAAPSTRASACPPTSRCRSSRQVGNYGEIFDEHITPARARAGPQPPVVRRWPAVRPAVPLIG